MDYRGKKSSSSRRRKNLKRLNLGLLIIYAMLAVVLSYLILNYNVLAFRYLNVIVIVSLMGIFMLALGLLLLKKSPVFTAVLLGVSLLMGSISVYVLKEVIDLSSNLNAISDYSEYEMSIVVPVDSEIDDVHQLSNVLAPVGNDSDNINALVENLSQTKSVTLTTEQTSSYLSAYQSLISGQAKAMVLNSVFEPIIASEDAEYATKIKKIYTYKRTKKVETARAGQTNGDMFNIYISGIDTYGPVSSVSRSDVNIIMTVNRQTKKVLLTTTPRDTYVPIADGGANQPDKLTHAGIYGVDASRHTLENLYGINLNYYARLNFTSFLKLIDLIGGIDVYNDQEFTSGNQHFSVGDIRLNSEQALIFVRERYSLNGGDNDRGRNQEKVITAVITKLSSPEALKNYSSIISGLQDSIQTDMPLSVMMDLVNTQLESGGSYTVTSQALEGSGTMGLPSYAMPEANLYMMEINQESLVRVKSAIQQVLEGK